MSDFIKQRMRLIKKLIDTYQRDASLDEVLAAVTQGLVDEFEAAFARLWLIERQADGQEALILKASSGMYTNLHGSRSRIPLPDASKLGQIVASRRGHFTNDTYHDPGVLDKTWARTNRLVALAGYPLISFDRDDAPPFGVLLMYRRTPIRAEEYEILDLAVAQIINIIMSHGGFGERQRRPAREKPLLSEGPSFWARLFGRA